MITPTQSKFLGSLAATAVNSFIVGFIFMGGVMTALWVWRLLFGMIA